LKTEQEKLIQYRAELILLSVSVFWGLSFPLIKIGLNYSSPFIFVFARFLLTTLLYGLLNINKLKQIKFREYKYGFILGIFLFIGFLAQTTGMKYTTASKSAFITSTNLAILPFVSYFIVKKKPCFENIIGILLVLTGLYFLTEMQDMKMNTGDLITAVCAVSFAVYIVLLDKYSSKASLESMLFGQFVVTLVFSLIASLIFEKGIYNDFKFEQSNLLYISIFINAVFSTLYGMYITVRYQRFTTPVRAGLIYSMEQVFAVIFAFFILNEIMNGRQIFGAVIMISGFLFSEFFIEIKLKFRK